MAIDTLPRQLAAIAGGNPNDALVGAIANGITTYGAKFGLDHYSRLTHFIAQVAHESGRFRYNEEIWGPTAAQRGYEGRRDLGNTVSGDGHRFRGRGPIQLTGRANYRSLTIWARRHIGASSPDFEADPDLVTKAPWNFLAAVAYWDAFNPTGKSLNRYADENNIEAVTRKVNGGLNGFADRCELYTRAALVFLGYELKAGVVAQFQRDAGFAPKDVDDVAGTKTRAALHEHLVAKGTFTSEPPIPSPEAPSAWAGLLEAFLRLIRRWFGK